MKTFKHALFALTLPIFMLAAETSQATRLQKVETVKQSTSTMLRLHFDEAISVPRNFMMQAPEILILDFPDTTSTFKLHGKTFQSDVVKDVKFAHTVGKLRVMISLKKSTPYSIKVVGKDLLVTFLDGKPDIGQQAAAPKTVPYTYEYAKPKKAKYTYEHAKPETVQYTQPVTRAAPIRTPVRHSAKKNTNRLGIIDFRRESSGDGRVIIPLSNPNVKAVAEKRGNKIHVVLKNMYADKATRRLNVLDFATPASYIDVNRRGSDVHIDILARTSFTYETRKEGNNFIVLVKAIKKSAKKKGASAKSTADRLRSKKKVYKGKKLSLNFQDIEVRSVLQLLADFTDKNIVVSDSVQGNITLRLKNVPWDQALDIVLESKALGMRSNGNVIWVAPATELAAKEQQELQAQKRIKELEPLVTEYVAINFARAEDLIELVRSTKSEKSKNLLSDRGSISVDVRTNTLLIQDTVSSIDAIREMVRSLDVPISQVSIESRIVIATDDFGKDLGARFGISNLTSLSGNSAIASGGTSSATNSLMNAKLSGEQAALPALSDRLNVNLPIAGAAGNFGFSILAKDFLLDLELSALQAERKGEVVSTPRVVTANKKKALIEQGVEVPYLEASSSGATSVSFKKAVLSLEVTPQVTPDHHVIMDLKINQDTVGSVYAGVPSINTREISTQVLVKSGQTVVLGGVHEKTKAHDVEKVPFLGDLPYVGNLFKRSYQSDDKSELLIFVTPKVLD